MGCIGIFLPILGLVGYFNDIGWLFYIAGGLATIFDIIAVFTGALRCFGSLITIACWIRGYTLTHSIVSGVILGSCASYIVIVVVTFLFMAITAGTGAAIAGITKFFHLFKK